MKKYISAILINALLFQFAGCYTLQPVAKEEILSTKDYPGLSVTTFQKQSYYFEADSYTISNDTLDGIGSILLDNGVLVERNVNRSIAVNDIEIVKVDEVDIIKSVLIVAGVVAATIIIILGMKSLMDYPI